MSIKKKIASILFGQKPEETEKEPPRPQVEQPEQEPSESTAFAQEDPSLIKLPGAEGTGLAAHTAAVYGRGWNPPGGADPKGKGQAGVHTEKRV